ncbi:hypothetical protein KNE206_06180 [Kitasatospora sp. NE20-6]|uniref:hypothetical protein n=1 Tax=Kitasatospora sp. NE20-6 TaxID=2859066 RepID=UPI0034DC1D8C
MDHPVDRLCARLHLALRAGRPDPADVAALACELLDLGHGGPAVTEAVGRRPGDVPAAELPALARRLLDEAAFSPGFALAPERLATLRSALAVVARDLRAGGFTDEPRLVVQDGWYPESAGVVLADGWLHGGDLPAETGDRLSGAVAAVAAHVQESVTERDRTVWPLCPDHRLGLHAVQRDGAALWWCAAGPGHPAAAVGALPPTARTSRRSPR